MAVIPYTPSALNVLRSAWIPAPPPESDPAMVSTFGLSASTAPKVIPPFRRERRDPSLGVDGDDPRFLRDLTDLRQLDPEPRRDPSPRLTHRVRWQRREELVVLSTREGQAKGIDGEDASELAELGSDRDRCELHPSAGSALPAQPRKVEGEAVREVHHGGGAPLPQRPALPDPGRRVQVSLEQGSSPRRFHGLARSGCGIG